MIDFKKTSGLVKYLLETKPECRNSDSILYKNVLHAYENEHDTIILSQSVGYFLSHMDLHGCPGFETVRRSRQKIQADHPELRAAQQVEDARMENEKEFRAFAIGGGC